MDHQCSTWTSNISVGSYGCTKISLPLCHRLEGLQYYHETNKALKKIFESVTDKKGGTLDKRKAKNLICKNSSEDGKILGTIMDNLRKEDSSAVSTEDDTSTTNVTSTKINDIPIQSTRPLSGKLNKSQKAIWVRI